MLMLFSPNGSFSMPFSMRNPALSTFFSRIFSPMVRGLSSQLKLILPKSILPKSRYRASVSFANSYSNSQ